MSDDLSKLETLAQTYFDGFYQGDALRGLAHRAVQQALARLERHETA